MPDHHNLKAITFTVLAFFLFTVGDTISKFLISKYDPIQLFYMVGLVSVCMIFIYGGLKEGKSAFKTNNLKLHIFRGICATGTGLLNFLALQTIRLDEFYAVIFTAPLWVTIAGYLFLKDEIGWHRAVSLLAGFVVLIFMLRPGGDLLSLDAGMVLISAILFACTMTAVRCMKGYENPLLFSLSGPLASLVITFPMLFFVTEMRLPSFIDMLVIISASSCFVMGGILIGVGFRLAHSSAVVAPFHYTQIIWGTLLGYFVFSDVPTMDIIIGSTCLAGIGIYLAQREAKLHKIKTMEAI